MTTELITKKKTAPSSPVVRETLSSVREFGGEGAAALELALMELALVDLHLKRDQIRDAGMKAVQESRTKTSKYYRAVAKTRFQTGIEVPELMELSKSREIITVSEYQRKDGTVVQEHTRVLPTGQRARSRALRRMDKEEREAIEDALKDTDVTRRRLLPDTEFGDLPDEAFDYKLSLKDIDGMAEKVLAAKDNEVYSGAVKAFLSESKLGSRIVAVADFFSHTTNRFQFAARAIAEFGPIVGARVAYNYFRFGGYEVPMSEVDGRVKTGMGDKLPEVKSQSDTRNNLIEILKKRLPREPADEVGAEPPSEGFIIDKDGNVIAHGVGRGHDHFLPFSARQLRKLRKEDGVEYVRRRMFGGPTVEDLHAAMMMGVDRVTVVSNGGTYIIELNKRSHGMKMEHMQILQRYQELLDKREKMLDFSAYNSALDALEAEFPLHFDKKKTERGDWDNVNDRIRPRTRFMTQLRELFSALGGAEEEFVPGPGRDLERRRQFLPGVKSGETPQEYYRRMRAMGRPRVDMLNRMRRYYEGIGTNPNQVGWLSDEIEAARRVVPPRGPFVREPAPVTVRPAPPQRATPVPPPTEGVRFTPRGRQRLEEIGLDVKGFGTAHTADAAKIAREANTLPDDAWERLQDDTDYLRHLLDVFGEITRPNRD